MAKDLKKPDVPEASVTAAPQPTVLSVPPVEKPVVQAPTAAALVISFDRWFATTGKPEHWKAGMKAHAQTSGKKTLAAWAQMFENY